MTRWHRSLTLRLSLAFALLATLVFATLGVYLGRSADAHMAELDAHELHGHLALVRHIAAQEISPQVLASRLGDALVGEHGMIVAVDGPQGAIFRWPETALADRLAAARDVGDQAGRLELDGRSFRAVGGVFANADGQTLHAVVARDIHHHTDFLAELQRDLRLALVAAAVLTMLVGLLIARHGLRPLREIARTAGRISAGQLAERIPDAGVPPELAELVERFNAMLDRLEDSFRRLSDFSADLAHELRTPLHTLRMQTEVSLSKTRSADDYRELLASNLEEYERLSRIIGDMLFLAKADNGLIVPQREAVDLRALCQRLLDYYGLLAEHAELALQGPPLEVPGDRLMLERAIGNLLVNAIKHTPPGGRIELRLQPGDGEATLHLANSGPAIPPAALERIFDRFVRLDPSGDGNGLGLAISRSGIRAHGGDIAVRSAGQLTEFIVRLPLAPGPRSD